MADQVLVQVGQAETATPPGLLIVGSTENQGQRGTVVAVGPGRWNAKGHKRIPLEVTQGDPILYHTHRGIELVYEGGHYAFLSARDVLAIVAMHCAE